MNRHDIERRRLERIAADERLPAWERDGARDKLDPRCPHCTERISSHNGAKCRVLDRFQRKHGKGLFPTPDQAASIRESIAKDEAEKARAERRKDLKGRQGSLF